MSMSGLQKNVLDAIEERLKKKKSGPFYAFKNTYPSGQYGSDLSLSFRFSRLLYFDFIFYCSLHEMGNDAGAPSLGNGWAVSDSGPALDELTTKDEANQVFREGLAKLLLSSSFHEIKKTYDKTEDSDQLLRRFMKDGEECSWGTEVLRETPRVTFYTLEKNSLASPEHPWLTWQIRTDSATGEIVGLHLGSAEYLCKNKKLPLDISGAFQRITEKLALG